MRSMLHHKAAYICFTVRRSFFSYFKSTQKSDESLSTPPPSSPFSDSPPQNVANLKFGRQIIDPKINGQHYDVAIIGGGSAGLAFANVILNFFLWFKKVFSKRKHTNLV